MPEECLEHILQCYSSLENIKIITLVWSGFLNPFKAVICLFKCILLSNYLWKGNKSITESIERHYTIDALEKRNIYSFHSA